MENKQRGMWPDKTNFKKFSRKSPFNQWVNLYTSQIIKTLQSNEYF